MAKKAEDLGLDVLSKAAVEEAEDESGGWRYDFIGEVPHDFLCVICLLPMKNPVQISSCGHCMCELCLERVLNR